MIAPRKKRRPVERMGLTQEAYGKLIGMQQSRVSRLLRCGHLVLFSDGSIDAQASDARRAALANDATRRRLSIDRQKKVWPSEVSAGGGASGDADGSVPKTGMTYLEAKTGNEVVRYQRAVLELQHYRGQLVAADAVEMSARAIAQSVRDAWIVWPARVAPTMAADLGVDPHAMHAELVDAVRAQLASMASEIEQHGVVVGALRADITRPQVQPKIPGRTAKRSGEDAGGGGGDFAAAGER